MIQINVSQLLKEPIGSERDYQISDSVNIMENGSSSMVYGDVNLTCTNGNILVRGKLNTTIELVCARCLDAFDCPIKLGFEEEYFPARDIAGGDFSPAYDEPYLFTIDDNKVIDLTEAIRQYTLVSVPMKPLCSQDCGGL